jgi:uncharacterized protein
MKLNWDEAKRQATLEQRELDFAWAAEVFVGDTTKSEDIRFDYGEKRFVSFGFIKHRLCVVVWTKRGENCHIISMRKANEREKNWFSGRIRPGG